MSERTSQAVPGAAEERNERREERGRSEPSR
jgi:hypothetical protein